MCRLLQSASPSSGAVASAPASLGGRSSQSKARVSLVSSTVFIPFMKHYSDSLRNVIFYCVTEHVAFLLFDYVTSGQLVFILNTHLRISFLLILEREKLGGGGGKEREKERETSM